MPCPNCKNVKSITLPEVTFSYTTNERRVLGRDGEMYLLTRLLVPVARQPSQGWGVVVELNGQTTAIKGTSPRSVAAAARRFLELNEVQITEVNLWFNLNVQWLSRLNEKYQVVTLETLLSLATP